MRQGESPRLRPITLHLLTYGDTVRSVIGLVNTVHLAHTVRTVIWCAWSTASSIDKLSVIFYR